MIPLHYRSLAEVSGEIASGTLTAVEVTATILDRITHLNPALGAFYTVFSDSASQEAKTADREIASGRHRGPLHGVPVALKDLIELGPTTAGSGLMKDHQATTQGALVERLREQGAVIVGKLATHEFGLSTQTFDDPFPPARNPWNTALTPGGSSTGAGVALAAGLVFGAYGTDSGGSVRLPAANCSIVGFKPTFGMIGRSGIIPLSLSLDHVGPMARTVADTLILLDAARGHDPRDPGSGRTQPQISLEPQAIDGLVVGVPRGFWEPGCDAEVRSAIDRALEVLDRMGARIREVDLGVSLKQVVAVGYVVALTEAAAHHAHDIRGRAEQYGREFRLLMKIGMLIPGTAYLDAQRARGAIARLVLAAFHECDVLVMPTLGALADPIPQRAKRIDRRISSSPAPAYTWLANLYGGPAISIPAGFSADGRPIGLQILGRPNDDAAVLRVAAAHERETSWSQQRPLP